MKPTIYFNGRFLGQRLTGVQRYARETLTALDELLATSARHFEAVVLAPPGTPSLPLKAMSFRHVGPLRGHAWEQLTLPAVTRKSWLVSFCPTGPALKREQVVTIHDAAVYVVPEAYGRAFRTWYKLLLPQLARRTPLLMTVSKFAKSELVRVLGADEARVRISGEGWQHIERVSPDVSVLAERGLRPKKYVLAVSSLSPHKNFEVVARALRQLSDLDLQFAVAGAVDPRIFEASSPGELGSLELLGYVSDERLRALYENAAMFVHPSYYEGFGIPPLEAMALGCPVIASNAAAIPEVCGGAALYFSPNDPLELAARIRQVASSDEERDSLVQRGYRQAALHSWNAAARCHLAVLEELVRPEAAPVRRAAIPRAAAPYADLSP